MDSMREDFARINRQLHESSMRHDSDPRASFANKRIAALVRQTLRAAMLAMLDGKKEYSMAFLETSKLLIETGKEIDAHDREAAEFVKPSVDPLVIIEGSGLEGAEAILINGARAVFVDWSALAYDPDAARSLGDKIAEYFDETDSRTDKRVDSILERLSKIAAEGMKPEPVPNADDPVDLGDYRGIPHTGKPNCPACTAFVNSMKL